MRLPCLLSALLLLAFGGPDAVCAVQPTQVSPPAQATAPAPASDTIRVAVLRDWPPHYQFPEGGSPSGFAVDVMEGVAERGALTLRWVPYETFPEAIAALRDGAVDVIPDLGMVEMRSDDFAFTRPFSAFRISIMVRESESRERSAENLEGMTVGVVRSNAAAELLSEGQPGVELVVFENVREALFELLAAGVDAVAYPEQVFVALAREVEVADRIRPLPGDVLEVPRAMGVRPGDTELLARLDRGLEAFIVTPEFEAAYQRWFAPADPFWTVERVAWAAGVLLIVVLLGMAAWRYRTVSRLASELEKSLEERKEVEAARREEDERFRTLVETAYEGILLADADNRIAFVNQRICDLVGLPEEEIVGKHLLHFVPEEDREEVRKHMTLRRQGVSDTYEVRIRRGDGTRVPVLLTAAPLVGEDGEFKGAVGTLTDITERVRAEEELERRERRFRAFAEHSSDLISNLDREGRMIYHSPPLKRLLDYEPEELQGRSVFDFVHPEDREMAQEVWEELVAEPGKTMELSRFRFRHKDGSWRVWESTLTNLLEEDAVGAVLSNARDITEREELERQLRQSQKLEAVGRLAGGIAHDFNNLLTVIRAQSDLILMDLEGGGELMEDVETIRDAADRATNLTSQLLAFSRDQVLRPRILDPNAVLTEFEKLVSRTLGEDIRVQTELDSDVPSIEVDPGQLDQALLNLAINARDAMPEGGTLVLTTGFEEIDPEHAGWDPSLEGGTYVRLGVWDTGVGMEEETLERIFEPFFTTRADEGGTGLGLSMVYGIVAQSGGTVTVESVVEHGTRFNLYFPAASGTPALEGRGTSSSEAAVRVGAEDGDGAPPESARVLLVDDDDSVRRVARMILLREGFDVTVAPDAETGLAALEDSEDGFDVVVTDLVLPETGGRQLIEILREGRPGISVVAMSGYMEGSPDGHEPLPSDVLFIQKPFTPEELGDAVRRALAGLVG